MQYSSHTLSRLVTHPLNNFLCYERPILVGCWVFDCQFVTINRGYFLVVFNFWCSSHHPNQCNNLSPHAPSPVRLLLHNPPTMNVGCRLVVVCF